jgi:hypothetical protein
VREVRGVCERGQREECGREGSEGIPECVREGSEREGSERSVREGIERGV